MHIYIYTYMYIYIYIHTHSYTYIYIYMCFLRRDDGHVLRRALDFEVEGQRKKGRPKRTLKKQVEEASVEVGLSRDDALYR